MMSPNRVAGWLAVALVLASIFASGPASAQATQTWISGVGDDANPCDITAPCKTFLGAISKTAASGEINCIDPGDFGGVTISKAITLNCNGLGNGGVQVSGTSGIVVNAGASDVVILDGLEIDGAGGNGIHGISFIAGGSLIVRNTVIRNFGQAGINFAPAASATLTVDKTAIINVGHNGGWGAITFSPTSMASVRANVSRSQISESEYGVELVGVNTTGSIFVAVRDTNITNSSQNGIYTAAGSAAFATVSLDGVSVVGSQTAGLLAVGARAGMLVNNSNINNNIGGGANISSGGVIYSYGNNRLNGNNGADGSFTPIPAPWTIAGRVRAAMALGAPRAMADIGVVATNRAQSIFPDGILIEPDDARIRYLGGRALRGSNFPYTLALSGQAVTAADPSIFSGTGLPAYRYGLNNGYEFTLPAGIASFEVFHLAAGPNYLLQVEIDGIATSSAGYPSGFDTVSPGSPIYTGFQLPASTVARRIRIWTGGRPFLGIRLPAGVDIGPLPSRPHPLSMVFQGDSITEGAVSTHPVFSWPMQAAYRLGIDNPINIGFGSSGYLRRNSANNGYNFRERLDDVLKAVDGNPPDVLVIAGGLNDCAAGAGSPFTPAEVQTESLAYFQALRAAAPNMMMVAVGPFTDWNNPGYGPTWIACRDAIFASASKVSGTYTIDVSDWVTPANRDTVFNGNAYGPHPVDAGHAIYGARFANAFASIVNGLP